MYLTVGLASSTHVDADFDQMTLGALQGMAEQINDHYIPLDLEHEPPVIGVVLCGKVERLPDGEWGLFIIGGVYESDEDVISYAPGTSNQHSAKYLQMLDELAPWSKTHE